MKRYNCICFDCTGSGRFKEDSEEELSVVECPECGSSNTKVLGFENGIFGKVASMSPKDRQTLLKKRSDEHYKKTVKPKKEYLDRSALGIEK